MKTTEDILAEHKQLTADLEQYLNDNESNWTNEHELAFQSMQKREATLTQQIEEQLEEQELNSAHPLATEIKTEPKKASFTLLTKKTESNDAGLKTYYNRAGDLQFKGIPVRQPSDLDNMNNEDRLSLLGEEMDAIQAGRARDFKAVQTTTDGSVVIQPQVLSSLYGLILEMSSVMRSGVPTIAMPQDTVKAPVLGTLPTAQWLSEGDAVKTSTGTLSTVDLTAKKVAAAWSCTDEFAAVLPGIVSAQVELLAASLAQALDSGFLNGAGTELAKDPRGILQYTNADDGITEVTGSSATAIVVDDLIDAVYSVLLQDYPGNESNLAAIYATSTAKALAKLKDANDLPLTNIAAWNDVKKYHTSKMPDIEAEAKSLLVFDPNALLIGLRDQVSLKFSDSAVITNTSDASFNAFSQFGQVWRAHMRADIAVVRPAFVSIFANDAAA